MIVLCSFVYPLALTGVSQLTMKNNANGNLIDKNGEPTNNIEEAVGSELVGQDFTEDYFFRGRVSSVNYNTYTEEQKENGEYTGVSSGSFNSVSYTHLDVYKRQLMNRESLLRPLER